MIHNYDFKSHMISRKSELYIVIMVLAETDLKNLQYAVINFVVKSEYYATLLKQAITTQLPFIMCR